MNNSHLDKIRAVYRIMEDHNVSLEFYAALNFADAIAALIPDLTLDQHARTNEAVRTAAQSGKKILAIKELRALVPGTSLKESKDAVEAVYGPVHHPTVRGY